MRRLSIVDNEGPGSQFAQAQPEHRPLHIVSIMHYYVHSKADPSIPQDAQAF